MSITKKFFVSAFVLAFAVVAANVSKADAAYVHTVTLKQGSSGSQVMMLQQTLNMTACKVSTSGAGSPGSETSYFGSKTKAAVMCFQASNSLSADGVVGPMTGAALAGVMGGGSGLPAGCSSTSGFSTVNGQPCNSGSSSVPGCMPGYMYSPTTGQSCSGGSSNGGALSGSFGSISDVSKLSQYNDEEVGEGEDDVKVVGFETEASNDGDIRLISMKVSFDPTGNTGSKHLDDYISGVKVWMGDTEIGSADVDNFTKNSDDTYSRTIQLDSSAIIRGDHTEKIYITVDAVNNLDSGDISGSNDSWTVGINNIRYEDGSGVVTTDSGTTGDLGTSTLTVTSAGTGGVAMNFVDFATAADTELKISKDSDSPEAGIVIVDDSNETEGIVLLSGKLKLSGDSDINIDEIPVTFTVGGGDVLSDIASNVTLVLDGEEYNENAATAAGAAAGTITFDNLDFDMSAGDTVDYEVRIDVYGTDDFNTGSTVTASITSDNRSAFDVENEEGDQVADSDKTGTAIGEAQEFRSEGISVELVSTSESVNSDATLGNYSIKFKVTAIGDDAYVGTQAGDGSTGRYVYSFEEASAGATTSGYSAAITNSGGNGNSTSTTSGGNWKINEGTSATFTLQVFGQGASLSAGAWRAALTGIKWDNSDADAVLGNTYTSNMDDFHTDYEQII